jgi:hypothetical protein
MKCPDCNGSGWIYKWGFWPVDWRNGCPKCHKSGYVPYIDSSPSTPPPVQEKELASLEPAREPDMMMIELVDRVKVGIDPTQPESAVKNIREADMSSTFTKVQLEATQQALDKFLKRKDLSSPPFIPPVPDFVLPESNEVIPEQLAPSIAETPPDQPGHQPGPYTSEDKNDGVIRQPRVAPYTAPIKSRVVPLKKPIEKKPNTRQGRLGWNNP